MRRKSAEKRRKEKTAFFRRAAAILLGLALCIQLLPFTGLAAETALTWKTMAPAARQAADGTAVKWDGTDAEQDGGTAYQHW